MKAAHEQKECVDCIALEEKLEAAEHRHQEQLVTGEKMLQDLKVENKNLREEIDLRAEDQKTSLMIEKKKGFELARAAEERLTEIIGFNVRWEKSYKNLEADFIDYQAWAVEEINKFWGLMQKEKSRIERGLHRLSL